MLTFEVLHILMMTTEFSLAPVRLMLCHRPKYALEMPSELYRN